jgi:Nif-specific regulatory protein
VKKNRPVVKREITELSLLYEISETLSQSMDLREVAGPVLKALAERMGMRRGTLTLLDQETGEIFIEAAYGLTTSQKERGRYRMGEGITGKVVATGQPAVVTSISEEPLFLNRTGARKRLRKKDVSFICVPIKLGREVIGALSVDRLFSDAVSLQEDVRLLAIIASMIAQAVKLRQQAQVERRRLLDENLRLQEQLKEKFRPANIIGNSKAMTSVYNLIATVAKSDATVLIRGESGTGKELVAHAIHYNSARAARPFIKVNLAALPETVIESELFGHEKGAFTDAQNLRKGRFELAQTGTIFLDEIGDLSPATQLKLLRVIQRTRI